MKTTLAYEKLEASSPMVSSSRTSVRMRMCRMRAVQRAPPRALEAMRRNQLFRRSGIAPDGVAQSDSRRFG